MKLAFTAYMYAPMFKTGRNRDIHLYNNGFTEKTAILLSLNKDFDKFLTTLCDMGGGEGNDVFWHFLMTSVKQANQNLRIEEGIDIQT